VSESVVVLGAGLAGSEAAWQLAQAGVKVDLFEMRPGRYTWSGRTSWQKRAAKESPGTIRWVDGERPRMLAVMS